MTTTTDMTTTETTMTNMTTTEMTTTHMTTTETTTKTTTETTTTPMTTTPNITISKTTTGNRTQTSISSHATVFPTRVNTTNFHSSNSSAGNATVNSTAVPVSSSAAISHTNATANSSNLVPPVGTNATNSSSVAPTSAAGGGTVISSTKGNGNSSTQVVPTRKTSVTAQGSTTPRQTPVTVLGSSSGPSSSKATALLPAAVQLLLRVSLSFRILNRSFNESLRDPTSKEYRSLSRIVLTMFEYVFGCTSCMGGQVYKGCSELHFSQGSVEVQSILLFGHGNDTVTSDAAERRLRNSLDQNGFIMDLHLASIQSALEVTSPAPVPVVPDWAIALLVLVCILLLLSILTCLLLTPCRQKSHGKLDLFSTKDSYHPMAEYPPYQSHGRYVSPASKPNPYSQVASSNGAGVGTFTYTNSATASDNL
ncbi:mucin-1 [Sarcoramphus papa]